jgi:protein O-GlcNAc transferase
VANLTFRESWRIANAFHSPYDLLLIGSVSKTVGSYLAQNTHQACKATPPMSEKQDHAERLFEAASQLTNDKRFEEAIGNYEQVIALQPGNAAAYNNLGFCLQQLGFYEKAQVELQRALSLKADFVIALVNLINSFVALGKRFEAIPYRRRLSELEPSSADHCFQLAELLSATGRIDESLFYLRRALALAPHFRDAAANYLLYLHYSDVHSPEYIAREHFRLAQVWMGDLKERPTTVSRSAKQVLRIGYLSADFYTHPVGRLILPVIERHNRDAFEVYCYHHGSKKDAVTDLLIKAANCFRTVDGMSSSEVFAQLQRDEVDVLVDLGGYTGGSNRLELFAAKAAPIQVSFLGYPDTTGLNAVDYRITDQYCDPFGKTDGWHSERLIRLTKGFLCFRAPDELPPVAESPLRRFGHVRFGCFNNIAKISESAFKAWAKIVSEVPGSRLLFKYGDRYESLWIQEQVKALFARNNVDPCRLEFLKSRSGLAGHLEVLGEVDIALDAFPYQGTMTTLETLLMSVPVVTLEGDTYSQRASSSLLRRLGFSDLVTNCVDEYVRTTVELAHSADKLDQLRGVLRERLLASDICDEAGFTKELEAAYRNMAATSHQ